MPFIIKMFLSFPYSAEVKHARTGKFFLLVQGGSSGSCADCAVFCPSPAPEKDLEAVRSFGVTAKAGICLVLQSMLLYSCSRI